MMVNAEEIVISCWIVGLIISPNKILQNRFVDDFYNVLRLPHDFNTEQERTVLVVSRSEDVQEKAIQMGATHAAGLEIIKQAKV